MTLVGLREKKKLEVRERLLDEAKRLFARENVDAVSIDRIAEAANVSRATFFNYFPSKSALLDELARRMTEKLGPYMETIRLRAAPLEVALSEWFALSAATIRKSESLSRLLFGRVLSGPGESELRASQMLEVHRAYAALVHDAVERGEIPKDSDVEFLAEMIAGAMTTLLNNWSNDARYPLESRAEETAAFLASAITGRRVRARKARSAETRGARDARRR